jgi:ATP-dependent Lon protease
MSEDKISNIPDIIEDIPEASFPETMPLLPVRDVVIFTDMLLPLFIGRDKSIIAVEQSMVNDKLIFLTTQKNPNMQNPKLKDLFNIGTVGRILRVLKLPDGRIKLLIHGIIRGKIQEHIEQDDIIKVKLDFLNDALITKFSLKLKALMRNVRENCEKILSFRGELNKDVSSVLNNIDQPGKLADIVAANMRLSIQEAQSVLEISDPVKRLNQINEFLVKEVELSMVQAKIHSDARDEIFKNQRDYFLREQVRAINKELGETDERAKEVKDYKRKIKRVKMTKEAEKEALKQVKRLDQMHPESSESTIIRTYLDWLIELPWSKSTPDALDIKLAKEILDKEHYGLDKVKENILEYLSVRKLNKKMKGPILCFVGPPGVGKTSLGQAIASAMKRKFVRISLGGIRDEAEIRGHRRTYIGALPGRILQGLKQCKTNNPLFMMDEIDKIGTDYRGDPSAALLEALDPEQNFEFSDHYINLPFNLSKVMFILTANMTDTIPSALLDRMEIINLPGYTEEEKFNIAKKHLYPRQIKENGLSRRRISITENTILNMINEYTSEAGVRNLERNIGKICRKIAKNIVGGGKAPSKIKKDSISKYLGAPKYQPELDNEESQVGLSKGLAWTQVGGEVLYIEASLLPGKGEIIITGQLGDVMQESVRAAISYAKAKLKSFGIKEKFFDNKDVHIHVPAGAIPKDGPSAGIAIASAIISAIRKKAISKDIAMTGEISLRGRVLPIGGLKEKSLGALRAGVTQIIIPEKNKKDLQDIPSNVKEKINFSYVSRMEEVLDMIFV